MDASDWEPDGTTLHVRFCEGGGPYRASGMPAATLHTTLASTSQGPVLSELRDTLERLLVADGLNRYRGRALIQRPVVAKIKMFSR